VKDYIINVLQYLSINKLRHFAIYGIAGPLVDAKSLFVFNTFLQKIGYINSNCKFSGYNNDFFFNKTNFPKKICIFYNVNLRYISPVMNIFVRQSYLKHQTLFYYIGSNVVFNYYVKQLGVSSKHLILILLGKH
jgi:hypothetical protein